MKRKKITGREIRRKKKKEGFGRGLDEEKRRLREKSSGEINERRGVWRGYNGFTASPKVVRLKIAPHVQDNIKNHSYRFNIYNFLLIRSN